MSLLAVLLVTQILLGGFDNLWHHELSERLPGKREARVELALHSPRALLRTPVRGTGLVGMARLGGRHRRSARHRGLRDARGLRRRGPDAATADDGARAAHGARDQLGAMLAVPRRLCLRGRGCHASSRASTYGLASWLLTAVTAGVLA